MSNVLQQKIQIPALSTEHTLYISVYILQGKWELNTFPLKNALNELEKTIQPVAIVEKPKKGGKKNVSKIDE